MPIVMVVLILLNFWILGVGRINTIIKILVLQGFLVGVLPVLRLEVEPVILGIIIIILKAIIFPVLLFNVVSKTQVKVEEKSYVSYAISLILGSAFLFVAYEISKSLMVAIFIMMVGLFVTITRKKAINQVIGFLIFENGIFVLSFEMATRIPVVMEMAILIDVLVAVLVMGLSITQINQKFTHMDVDKLDSLKG